MTAYLFRWLRLRGTEFFRDHYGISNRKTTSIEFCILQDISLNTDSNSFHVIEKYKKWRSKGKLSGIVDFHSTLVCQQVGTR